jgi:Leucine-rich repeat (LRR) protein
MELYLNGNKISDISGLQFLPCLEYLNLSENKVEIGIDESSMMVLPNLRRLLIPFNHI